MYSIPQNTQHFILSFTSFFLTAYKTINGSINIAKYFIAVAIATNATEINKFFFLVTKYMANNINNTIKISLCTFVSASNNTNGFNPYIIKNNFFFVILYTRIQFTIWISKFANLKIIKAISIFSKDNHESAVQIIVHNGP